MTHENKANQYERELAVHRQDCPHFREFFTRYGLPSKLPPSCLVCGDATPDPVIRHAELPSVVVCATCRDAAVKARQGRG